MEYVLALGSNRRLEQRAQRLMGKARMRAKATGETAHLYGETRYAARKWRRKRRVIIKAEVVQHPGRAPKNNPRFVVTNLPHTPEHVYTIYRQRGDVENRIKELKAGVALDRLSCARFRSNQFRLLLVQAAFILMPALRGHATGTACATAQVPTLRERLLKVAVWIERSVRRIVLHLPAAFPWRPTWQAIACAVGARPLGAPLTAFPGPAVVRCAYRRLADVWRHKNVLFSATCGPGRPPSRAFTHNPG